MQCCNDYLNENEGDRCRLSPKAVSKAGLGDLGKLLIPSTDTQYPASLSPAQELLSRCVQAAVGCCHAERSLGGVGQCHPDRQQIRDLNAAALAQR